MQILFKTLQGLVLASLALLLTTCGVAYSQNVKTYVHPNAIKLAPNFKSELKLYFPEIPTPWYVIALSEHESCQTLKSSRCLSHTARFSTTWKGTETPRELGVGLSMITKAWTKDGKVRVDTLSGLKRAYPKELKDLTWENIGDRPDLQIRAMVLLLKQDYKALYMIPDPNERLKFTDSAYNGGRRDALSARKVCGLTIGCNKDIWFGHVEKHCVKSKSALYGQRSACDINTHHVSDVFKTRMPKYQHLLPNLEE